MRKIFNTLIVIFIFLFGAFFTGSVLAQADICDERKNVCYETDEVGCAIVGGDYKPGGCWTPEGIATGTIEGHCCRESIEDVEERWEEEDNEALQEVTITESDYEEGDYDRGPPVDRTILPEFYELWDFDVQFANIYNFLLPLGIIISVLMIIVAGYKYMTSTGQPDKVQAASESLTSAITGTVFILLSLAILKFIINTLFS